MGLMYAHYSKMAKMTQLRAKFTLLTHHGRPLRTVPSHSTSIHGGLFLNPKSTLYTRDISRIPETLN